MKIFKLLFLIFYLSLLSYANEDPDKSLHIGISINKHNDIEKNKMQSVLLRVQKEFNEEFKNLFSVKFILKENTEDLLNEYLNTRKLNCIVVYSSIYLENKEILKDVSVNSFSFNTNSDLKKYVLVVNKNSKIKSAKDIKNKKFASKEANDNYNIWLDYLSFKENKKSYKSLISEEKEFSSDKRLILSIYFDDTDFTVIRENIYNDMILLNPALSKKLEVIKLSKPIFAYGVGLFHESISKNLLDIFNQAIKEGTFDDRFKYIFKLINESSLKRITFDDLKDLEDFYDEYKNIKRKL